ncbi:polyprenol monophosphomannose synthase [candidate division KSB1 bacterium]|nr:polyprenol monophosphomannose synthase [candidate division KSB1 bacterium]NIR72814.1 polyprenol monophosphomannose synthase [candidate division KSB1 bacterium]NIS26854.1 polyprenol monophosphomannose synthase [candidate division KSB1 bacterium]NIT73650.1 polyprenol monophosphomannose synthase [candidate division KSB1 bacterium]NIU27521.1 polyprenol monophosphomannose synthase [candidate division KSB1 bacterium]
MNKTLIIIPTYNEADNIKLIIRKVIQLNIPNVFILVVDDNSPDGTAEIVQKIAKKDLRVRLILRSGKRGLGTAYVEGFKFAIKERFDYIFEMDADLSHDPAEIPKMLEAVKTYDLVVGSRYLTGVNVINWPLSRLLLSLAANWYARVVTRLPVKDCTSGFKCFRRAVLESIDLDKISSDGYSFQIEMTYKAWRNNFKICEVPIIFVDRTKGSSKMNRKVMFEATWVVWRLRLATLFRKSSNNDVDSLA